MNKCIIFGATSTIIQKLTTMLIADYQSFSLVARSSEKLEVVKNDLIARGAKEVHIYQCDFSNSTNIDSLLVQLDMVKSTYDLVIMGQGVLPDQKTCSENYNDFLRQFQTNFLSMVHITTSLVPKMKERKQGKLVYIGSVAGDRGRKSNYAYGTAKASLETFTQGLRNELNDYRIQVTLIKPGFVDTAMTANLKKGMLFASAEKVADGIYHAISSNKDTVYLPSFWMLIMFIIRNIPEAIFKKLSL
jgi:decaprenylphospho-beta-D-erythro-pentofuranosid-2-ulose 2-reductase